jgi:hypothetical protein
MNLTKHALRRSRGVGSSKIPACEERAVCWEGVNMNPRDFKKAAPFLGALLLAAVVFIVVRSLL